MLSGDSGGTGLDNHLDNHSDEIFCLFLKPLGTNFSI